VAVVQRNCDRQACRTSYEAKRSTSKFCSDDCRVRNASESKVVDLPASADAPPEASVAAAVRAELDTAGRVDTTLGQAALRLAARIDGGGDTGAGMASLSRELRATMDAALRNAAKSADRLDELAARREQKAAGA
jgi:hypothetical protein